MDLVGGGFAPRIFSPQIWWAVDVGTSSLHCQRSVYYLLEYSMSQNPWKSKEILGNWAPRIGGKGGPRPRAPYKLNPITTPPILSCAPAYLLPRPRRCRSSPPTMRVDIHLIHENDATHRIHIAVPIAPSWRIGAGALEISGLAL